MNRNHAWAVSLHINSTCTIDVADTFGVVRLGQLTNIMQVQWIAGSAKILATDLRRNSVNKIPEQNPFCLFLMHYACECANGRRIVGCCSYIAVFVRYIHMLVSY
ncbi:hypothetical protein PUN28_011001 [Cardiocondyla obscurior]|uniref:Uncharacterized protein n=1 Tax=Cardiocondyla obscurior TaxID=286306 RepID=A0AAW2FPL1_9HYME